MVSLLVIKWNQLYFKTPTCIPQSYIAIFPNTPVGGSLINRARKINYLKLKKILFESYLQNTLLNLRSRSCVPLAWTGNRS